MTDGHDIKLMRKEIAVYFEKKYYRMLLMMSDERIKLLWSVLKGRV